MVFTWDCSFLFLSKSPRGLSWSMIYVSSFLSFSFVSRKRSINSDFFFFYWFFSDRDVWIHGSMCLYRSCSWINENVQTLYLPLPFYESLPFCVWHRHSLWQHPLIRNLIWKPYFDPDVFGMPLITNEWQVLFLAWILFQWELDELIRLHVLLLLLYRELLHVLLDVKQIVELFLSFVKSFSRLDR